MTKQNISINGIKCRAWNEYHSDKTHIYFEGKLVYRSTHNEEQYHKLCWQGTNDDSYLVVVKNPADNMEHAIWFMNVELID